MRDNQVAPDAIDIGVGNRIRLRRKWLEISQGALADHCGVSFQQVQKYERGANRVSASMLVKIADRLDTTVAELVGETAVASPNSEMLELMATPGALELLKAFARLSQPRLRTAVLSLLRSLTGEAET